LRNHPLALHPWSYSVLTELLASKTRKIFAPP
jgi:hypothetical protein